MVGGVLRFFIRPALWIMGVYLIAHIWTVVLGIFIIKWEQYILKPFAVVIGSYFAFVGVMLIQHARGLGTVRSKQIALVDASHR